MTKDWIQILDENQDKIKKSVETLVNKKEECSKKGHPGEKVVSYANETTANCICYDCNEMYSRPMTPEEYKKIHNIVTDPMTI